MRKALFLDKDGTLIVDDPYNVDTKKIQLYEGVGETLKHFKKQGYMFVLITNQAGIARGLFTEQDLAKVFDHLQKLLKPWDIQLDDIYYCPHLEENCLCRKPRPGMIEQAAKKWQIDLKQSWMIGDILHDVEAGNRAGCRTIHIDNGKETEWLITPWRLPYQTVKTFPEITHIIH